MTLNAHQLSILRKMPSFAEMEERRIKAEANAARAERVAKGLELADRTAPPEPLPSPEVTTP